jgi:hypothetical protein
MELSNLGRLRSLQLPEGWLNTRELLGQVGNSYLFYFTPPAKPEVQICFHFRGKLLKTEFGARFESLLLLPPHHLTADEIAQVAPVIGNQTAPSVFELEQARTETINGITVLSTQGRYPDIDRSTYSIYINGSNRGCAVQEIYFCAPVDQYVQYLPEFLKTLQSVRWHDIAP